MGKEINKGDIFYANLDGAIGSEQKGNRPVVIVQNDVGNRNSPTTIVLPLTKKLNRKTKIPTHLNLKDNEYIKYDSTVLAEQIRVIDKQRLGKKLGRLNNHIIEILDNKMDIALGINKNKTSPK